MREPAPSQRAAVAATAGRAGLERGLAERLEGWLSTGPVGHLAAFLLDLGALFAELCGATLRRSARGTRSRARGRPPNAL